MQVEANLKYLRISARKMRLLANLIRNKPLEEARNCLNFSLKGAAQPLLKLLNSAVSSAKNNFHLNEEGLLVSEIKVDEGPKLKRWRARSRGRAYPIEKKTCHIKLVLTGQETPAGKAKIKEEPKAEPAETAESQENAKKTLSEKFSSRQAKTSRFGLKKQARREKKGGSGLRQVFRRKSF